MNSIQNKIVTPSSSYLRDPLPSTSRPQPFETIDEHGSIGFLTIPPATPTSAAASATVIWIHGLGGSGHGMKPFVQTLSRYDSCNHIKLILPHAFDLYSFDIPNRPEDKPGLFAAVQQINRLISTEIESGTPPHRIIVGGLSQGAALAVLTGLTTERTLGGIFVLSGYIPLHKKATLICSPLFPSIPLFFGHGTADQQVDHNFARDAAQTFASQLAIPFHLSNLSASFCSATTNSEGQPFQSNNEVVGLRFHSYENMGHEVIEMELEDLLFWIMMVLAKEGGGTEYLA